MQFLKPFLLGAVLASGAGGMALAKDPLTKDSMDQSAEAAQIVALITRETETSLYRATLTGCLLVAQRRDHAPDFADKAVPEADGTYLMSEITMDLKTTGMAIPDNLLALLTPHRDGAQPAFEADAGSAILYPTHKERQEGWLYLIGTDAAPLVFEEPVLRKRTARFVAKGQTRPSPRGDGQSFVFRENPWVVLIFKGQAAVAQLKALEPALMAYQARYCRILS